jgi:hypothetical protein
MCTKKELVEWLEANVHDDTLIEIWEYDTNGGRYYPLDLGFLAYDPNNNSVKLE